MEVEISAWGRGQCSFVGKPTRRQNMEKEFVPKIVNWFENGAWVPPHKDIVHETRVKPKGRPPPTTAVLLSNTIHPVAVASSSTKSSVVVVRGGCWEISCYAVELSPDKV